MEIKEIVNKKIKLKPIKMNTNAKIPDGVAPFDRYNFAMMVVGRPGSGKTTMIINQLTDKGGMFYKKYNKIFIFSPSLNTIQKQIHLPPEQIINEFDIKKLYEIIEKQKEEIEEDSDEELTQVLLIFDDMLADLSKDTSKELMKIIYNRRHLGLSIIMTTQVLNKIKASMRKAFSDIVFFNTSNNQEHECFREECTNFTKDEYRTFREMAFVEPHDFIMCRLSNGKLFRNFNELIINKE